MRPCRHRHEIDIVVALEQGRRATVDLPGTTSEDQRYGDAIAAWKAKRLHSTPRELVPASWRAKVSPLTDDEGTAAGELVEIIDAEIVEEGRDEDDS